MSPHRSRWLMIGVDEAGLDEDVVDFVRPNNVHRRQLRKEGAIGGVRAIVEQHPTSPSRNRSIGANPGLEVDHHRLASAVRGEERLVTTEHLLDRTIDGSGQGLDVRLEVEAALATEPATEVGHDDADSIARQLQGLADASAGIERNLRR